MDFGDDLSVQAKEQLKRIVKTRQGQREKIPPQMPANPIISKPQISLSQSTPSKEQGSSKQILHPLAPGVDVALGIVPFTHSPSPSTEESPLLDTTPDFRVNLAAVTLEPSPL